MYLKLTRKNKKVLAKDVDSLMLVVAVIQPFMAIPQVYTIYANQSAENVSLLTWTMFTLLGLVSFTYAFLHRIKPYMITQSLWILNDLAIIVGILLYRS
jgi:uncharacterized protein with PQ loop repeat